MSYEATIKSGSFNGHDDVDLSDRWILHQLDAMVQMDIDVLHRFPELAPLYTLHDRGLVRYYRPSDVRTPSGTVSVPDYWRDIRAVMEDGFGDCKDLTAWRVAEILVAGGQAKPALIKGWGEGDKRLYHVVVGYPDGRTEDPSRRLGMTSEF